MSRFLAPGCVITTGATRARVVVLLTRVPFPPPISPPLFFHSRFSSNSSTHRFHGYRSAMYLLFRYVFVRVCARASRRIRHTEDTRIQAEQIKRRLPGIIRSVARRGARTNQAASLFPAPELAFLFFPPSFFLSFLFFYALPFFFSFLFFFLFFSHLSPRSRYSTTIGANGARNALSTVRERNFAPAPVGLGSG